MKDIKLASVTGARFVAALADGGAVDGRTPPNNVTPEDLARINALPGVLVPYAGDDLYVRHMEAISDRVLKLGWRIPAEEMPTIARLAVLKPVMCNHDTFSGRDALPVGTVYAGKVEKAEDGATLVVLSFFAARTAGNTELIQRIDGGNITEDSIGFGFEDLVCNVCAGDYEKCPHAAGETYSGKLCVPEARNVREFREVSLVYEGAAQGTRFRMAASAAACALPEFPGKPAPGTLAALFAPRRPPLTWEQFFTKSHGSPAP